MGEPIIVRWKDLAPSWHLPKQEPGLYRWMISWIAGPEGYYNSNPGYAALSHKSAVGLMHLPAGNRQRGLHYHSVAEIYVVLRGQVMGWDGHKKVHIAGPMDCVYIPAKAPHGVRNFGGEDVDLIWVHDALEKKGTSVYWDDSLPNPQTEEIQIIKFQDLEPRWEGVKEPGHAHSLISYVGGREGLLNFNREHAALNDKIAIGMTVILPGMKQVSESRATDEVYIVVRGKAVLSTGNKNEELGYLDAVYMPANGSRTIRNHGDGPLYVMWVHEGVQPASEEPLSSKL